MPVIREAGPDDVPAIAEFWVSAWQSAMPDIEFEGRREWFSAHLSTLAADGVSVLAAYHDGRPVGVVTVDRVGYIDQLAVARAHQRSGIARELLRHARLLSPGRLTLSVNADNSRAISFYIGQGFVQTGRGVSERSGLPILHMAG